MKTYRIKTVLLLYLITGFLLVQWPTAHMHLSTQHEHDGGLHHHSVEAHAHHTVSHHANQIETSPQASDGSVVELNAEYRLTNSKKQKKLPDTIQASLFQAPLVCLSKTVFSETISSNSGYLSQTTVYLRGPPLFS